MMVLAKQPEINHDCTDCLSVSGRNIKKFVKAIQILRILGAEDLIVPSPRIGMVGTQPTGKPSLIEGISEIKVTPGQVDVYPLPN